MSWLEDHIENFVMPRLNEEYSYLAEYGPKNAIREELTPLCYFKPEEMTVIKNIWRSVKRASKGKTVLLAGRDVFIFEILAQREQYPTLFMPEISRMTVRHVTIPNLEELFLFDTGFAGSIPRGLGIEDFMMLSHAMRDSIKVQVFPRLTFSRGLALKIEKTPKYWKSARMMEFEYEVDAVVQEMAEREEFIAAARLTVEIYKNSTPKFISEHRPIGKEAQWMF